MIATSAILRFYLFLVGFLIEVLLAPSGRAQDVLTERYDNARTGATIQRMNSDTVRQDWGKLGELPVDGRVYAQPLVVERVPTTPGALPRNVIYVATGNNRLYAFDANTLAPIWDRFLGQNDKTKMGSEGCDGISADGIGIEATPVIDRDMQRMFVSYRVNLQGSPDTAHQQVVALDLRDGRTVAGPVEVQGPGFVPRWERSRASLLLQNRQVYVAFASRCEDPGMPIFHGFIFAFDERLLGKSGEFQVTPGDTDGGGIWQASSGLAGDGTDIYFMSGNRRLEVGNEPQDAPNYADSFVRLHPEPVAGSTDLTFNVRDWFSPYRKLWLDLVDLDLGSAGPVLIPKTKYLLGSGKQGWLYLLDRDTMGKIDANKKWTPTDLRRLRLDSTEDQFPEDLSADKMVQKFQVGFQQYIPVNPSYLSPPGSPVAIETQNGNQLDVFNVGRDGAVFVTWQVSSGEWSDGNFGHPYSARITQSITHPGAYVAAAHQSSDQLDAFVAGNDGAIYVTWVVGVGRWTDGTPGNGVPARITPPQVMPAGGCVITAAQTSNQLDVFYVGNDGAVYVTWVVGLSHWSDGTPGNPFPARITPANFAVPGACVATGHQGANQLDAFVVNRNDNAVWVTWVVGTGIWTDGIGNHGSPTRITPVQVVDPLAVLAAARQISDQLDVFYPGRDGAVHVTWVVGLGHWSDGTPGNSFPASITPANVVSPTGGISTAQQTANQLDVFYVQSGGPNNGTLMVTWVVGVGHWSDGTPGNSFPAPTTQANFTEPSLGHSAASNVLMGQLQTFVVGAWGAVATTHVSGVGHWTDGRDGNPKPQRLSRALWMFDWVQWPHVHGSPVFAQFTDGSARLFVWPEKDHLKSFAWAANRFDLQSKVLGVDLNGLLLDPDGMPGGMLAVAVDPSMPRGGALFASLTRDGTTDGPGLLRAFDAITLREIWNNKDESYKFSKFVPPTIANGRVYLPTCSNKVIVYGRH
jgi:hypothetical protein